MDVQQEFSKLSGNFFQCATVEIKFRDKVLAGIPRRGDMLGYFLESKHMSDSEKVDFKERIERGNLSDEEKEEIKEVSWCSFERDHDEKLVLWHGNVKAMLREVFVVLGYTQKRPSKLAKDHKDVRAYTGGRQTLQHAIHVDPLRVPFTHNGDFVQKPDGTLDKVKHIQDASGKRSALGRHDYLEQPEMTLVLKWPRVGNITQDNLKQAVALAQEDGLGACRSQGFGKFDVVRWDTEE